MPELNVKNRTLFIRDNLNILDNINSDTVDLIYLDPPFNSNRYYSAPIGSTAAGTSFNDAWTLDDIDLAWVGQIAESHPKLSAVINAVGMVGGKGDKAYLVFMARRLLEMHRILKSTGSIYLHCDPTMSHSLKLVMDCIFGKSNFRNEITWRIGWVSGYKTQKKGFIRNHDILLYYVKNPGFTFCKEYIPYPAGYVRRDGKPPTGKGVPIEDTWNCSNTDVLDSIMIKSFSKEKTGYPTQKPIVLLERIIKASSNEGDVVLDPFCGCATTMVAAERLNRQWIGIDVSNKAVDLIKMRLQAEKNLLTKHVWKGVITRGDYPTRTDNGAIMVNPKKFKHTLFAKQEGVCAGCKYNFHFQNLTIDHIRPRVEGGQDIESNLQLLCGACNSIKGNRPMEFLRAALKERGTIK